MFRIYITAKALADIYLQESKKNYSEQCEWFHILLKQKKIFTTGYVAPDSDTLLEDDLSDSGIIAEMEEAYNITFIPSDTFIDMVKADNNKVNEQPNAAYFLDIDSETAKHIQDDYGVICQPATTNIDTSIFTEECLRFEFIKKRTVNGEWKDLFEVQANVPSNAMCIIDRFLFCYDGQENPSNPSELIYNGLDTVYLILLNALPNKFKGTYHLTVICEKKEIKNHLIFQTLQYELFRRVNLISTNKGYPIFAQLIAIDGELASYTNSLTHNRQIISNYHKMFFLNGINAINYYSGALKKAVYTQTVQGELLYSTGLRHSKSECPANSIDATRHSANYIIGRWKAPDLSDDYTGHYFYADNKGNTSIRNIENRLFL